MRFVIFNTAMALCLVLLVGCASTPPAAENTHLATAGPECPQLEGSPDCQDGHQVDLTTLYRL
jgi:hypothetical protein